MAVTYKVPLKASGGYKIMTNFDLDSLQVLYYQGVNNVQSTSES